MLGEGTQQQREEAWRNILDEYSDLTKTEKSTAIYDCYKKITRTKWMLQFLSEATEYLKHEYCFEIAEQIFELGYDFVQEDADRDEYLKQILMVQTEAKTLIVLLNQYNIEYEKLTSNRNAAQRTEMDYDKELAMLSKFMGKWIRAEEISVYDFITIANLYNEYLKQDNDGKR